MKQFLRTNRLVLLFALSFVVLLAALFVYPNISFAQATPKKGFTCLLLPEDSGLPVVLESNKGHSTLSASGNFTIHCKWRYSGPGLPSSTIIKKGWPCATEVGVTTDSKLIITPSGVIHAKCKVKKADVGG